MATWTGAKLKNKRTDNVQAYGRFSLCFLTLRLDVAERVSRGGGGVFIIIIFFSFFGDQSKTAARPINSQ